MQLALLGFGEGHLFGEKVFAQYLEGVELTPIPDEAARAQTIKDWLASIPTKKANEPELEPKFLHTIIAGVLGYTLYPPEASGTATAWSKPPTWATGIRKSPDLALGAFHSNGSPPEFLVAGELKKPGTALDAPQARESNFTPVEQAFDYGESILGVKWVLVSDMRVLRLYSVESNAQYESFDLAACVDAFGKPTREFRRLYFVLHHDYLVQGGEKSTISALYDKAATRRLEIRDGFYDAYYQIRTDLYAGIEEAAKKLSPEPDRTALLEATQRLLDRLMFIHYCEHHPLQLIPRGRFASTVQAARHMAGQGATKIYDQIKALFRDVDVGNAVAKVPAYNGELFKPHPIIDQIELDDALDKKVYKGKDADGSSRSIFGVWGLHVYDFWTELSEHLLGHIFEESLSDMAALGAGREVSLAEKMEERKRGGIFYTRNLVSDFLAGSVTRQHLNDPSVWMARKKRGKHSVPELEARLDALANIRAIDFACGSGAFLVSVYRELVHELWRITESIASMSESGKAGQQEITSYLKGINQASLLRKCLYGIDLLPQAVEIAKLALWLRSARKGEKVSTLARNLVAGNSLDLPNMFDLIDAKAGSFDLVVGNPPWGAAIEPSAYSDAVSYLKLPSNLPWDSWELFLLLGVKALKPGGRLALVLPDSFLYPEKAYIRQRLTAETTIEKVHNLGPDWFGGRIRMSTILLQAKKGIEEPRPDILSMLLLGKLRNRALKGEVPLSQIEAQRSRRLPGPRCAKADCEFEVFRDRRDDAIIRTMEKNSWLLGAITDHGRGEEINKAGLLWKCSGCGLLNLPGEKEKGGGYKAKKCNHCGNELTGRTVDAVHIVTDNEQKNTVPFIDGDDIDRRYKWVQPSSWLRLDVPHFDYKDGSQYGPPKLMIRQAGVGVLAILDSTRARCPQSVYVYRLKTEVIEQGVSHEYLLAALLSRSMNYFVLKRFAEADPAKAFAKLTHTRLLDLPIPALKLNSKAKREIHGEIKERVQKLLTGKAGLGGVEDLEIELRLRQLWGLNGEQGAYINGEFGDLPMGQVIKDLFPNGAPQPFRGAPIR